jgi:hypothetical protein
VHAREFVSADESNVSKITAAVKAAAMDGARATAAMRARAGRASYVAKEQVRVSAVYEYLHFLQHCSGESMRRRRNGDGNVDRRRLRHVDEIAVS